MASSCQKYSFQMFFSCFHYSYLYDLPTLWFGLATRHHNPPGFQTGQGSTRRLALLEAFHCLVFFDRLIVPFKAMFIYLNVSGDVYSCKRSNRVVEDVLDVRSRVQYGPAGRMVPQIREANSRCKGSPVSLKAPLKNSRCLSYYLMVFCHQMFNDSSLHMSSMHRKALYHDLFNPICTSSHWPFSLWALSPRPRRFSRRNFVRLAAKLSR